MGSSPDLPIYAKLVVVDGGVGALAQPTPPRVDGSERGGYTPSDTASTRNLFCKSILTLKEGLPLSITHPLADFFSLLI